MSLNYDIDKEPNTGRISSLELGKSALKGVE